MELLAELTKLIMTNKGLNKYAQIVAETDMIQCGVNVRILDDSSYVHKILIKEKIHEYK